MKAYAAMGLLHAGIAVALRAAGGSTPMTREGRGGQRRRGTAAEPGHLTGYVGAP
jgi:hypothetical protein